MKTYLSIDLDYWNEQSHARAVDDLDYLIDEICGRELPFKVVFDHEKLLSHLRQFDFRRLINVDFHSDVANIDTCSELQLNCGTWVNFVPHCRSREYLWVHPGSLAFGRCDQRTNVRFPDIYTGWGDVEETNKDWRKLLDWKDVVAVGISLSPDFTAEQVLADFIVKLHAYGRFKYVVVDSP